MFMRGAHSSIWGSEPRNWTIPLEHRSKQGNRLLDVDVKAGLTQFDVAVNHLQSFLGFAIYFRTSTALLELESIGCAVNRPCSWQISI
jgi:hypothetical protein